MYIFSHETFFSFHLQIFIFRMFRMVSIAYNRKLIFSSLRTHLNWVNFNTTHRLVNQIENVHFFRFVCTVYIVFVYIAFVNHRFLERLKREKKKKHWNVKHQNCQRKAHSTEHSQRGINNIIMCFSLYFSFGMRCVSSRSLKCEHVYRLHWIFCASKI